MREDATQELEQAFRTIVDQNTGEVLLDGHAFVLVQRETLADLQRGLEEILGRGAEGILIRAGHKRGEELSQRLAAMTGEDDGAFVHGLKIFAARTGLCRIDDVTVGPAAITIRTSNSFLALGYGTSPRPVCHYLRGFLMAAAEHLLRRKEVLCSEARCIAMGDAHCEFTVAPMPARPSEQGSG